MAEKSRYLNKTGRALRILIADPRTLFRGSLGLTIEQIDPGMSVEEVESLADVDERFVNDKGIGVILLHIHPHLTDEQLRLRRFRERVPDVPIAVLADVDDPGYVVEILKSGANGYIPTTLNSWIMVEALRLISVGGNYIPDSVVRHLHSTFDARSVSVSGIGQPLPPGFDELTARQHQVLESLRQGKSNKLIAHQLGITPNTVKAHLTRIMKKLHANNRTEAVVNSSGLVNKTDAANRHSDTRAGDP